MNENEAPCFASIRHLASVARLREGTAKNILTQFESDGVILTMGYRGATKNRVVTPDYSNYRALSERLITEYNETETSH